MTEVGRALPDQGARQLQDAFERVTQLVDHYRRDAAYQPPETVWEQKAKLLNRIWATLIEGRNVFAIDAAHVDHQRGWSERTFGPGAREAGVIDHIAKELSEIEMADNAADKLAEWVDVIILALDGAWRTGADSQAILDAVQAKQARNEGRVWPDWRTAPVGQAIEHDRSHDAAGVSDENHPPPCTTCAGSGAQLCECDRGERPITNCFSCSGRKCATCGGTGHEPRQPEEGTDAAA